VLFPALSKLKNKKDDFNKVYLSFVEILAIITFPLFIGGILIANELVILVLGEKWSPAIIPLQLLLAAQLVMALSAPNSLIHAARGVPKWNLLFNLILTPFLVLGFYLSANQNDLYKLAIPWISIYPLFQFCYIYITNKELGISLKKYLSHLINPIIGCLMIFIFIILVQYLWVNSKEDYIYLLICILGSAFLYVLFFFTFGKSSIKRIIEFKNSNI
jgi:O-antigen/teichoic acid export membrane protein